MSYLEEELRECRILMEKSTDELVVMLWLDKIRINTYDLAIGYLQINDLYWLTLYNYLYLLILHVNSA